MRISEFRDQLPATAGVAPIVWHAGPSYPQMKDEKFFLPKIGDLEFFALQEGKKFFAVVEGGQRCFLGGDDEGVVFLKEMTESEFLLKTISLTGEKGFLRALIPEGVEELCALMKVEPKRIGGFFVVKLPPWASILAIAGMFGMRKEFQVFASPKTTSLPGSENNCFAKKLYMFESGFNRLNALMVAEGSLKVGNREPVVLDGPHAIFRGRFLD